MELYYRAFDVHEMLAHRAAELGGCYQEAGVEVELKNGSGPGGGNLETMAPLTMGVGGAILSRLSQGAHWVIASVNTQHPLFWFATDPSVKELEQLKGKRVAAPPSGSAPALFCRIVLRRHGLDLEKDCIYLPKLPGESAQMLKGGEVDACFVNSHPFDLERAGYSIFFFGAEVHAATTGLAVNQKLVALDAPEVQQMVGANRLALGCLHRDRDFALRVIRDIKPEMSSDDAALLYDRYIHPYWTVDGNPSRAKAEESMAEIARELGLKSVPLFSEVFKTQSPYP